MKKFVIVLIIIAFGVLFGAFSVGLFGPFQGKTLPEIEPASENKPMKILLKDEPIGVEYLGITVYEIQLHQAKENEYITIFHNENGVFRKIKIGGKGKTLTESADVPVGWYDGVKIDHSHSKYGDFDNDGEMEKAQGPRNPSWTGKSGWKGVAWNVENGIWSYDGSGGIITFDFRLGKVDEGNPRPWKFATPKDD